MATIPASENEFPQVLFTEGAAASTPASGLIVAYAKAGGVFAWKDDGGTEHIVGEGSPDADTVVFDPTGLSVITGTDVQTALEELDAGISGGGIAVSLADDAGDMLVASANDTWAKLATPTANGQSLRRVSGSPAWAFPPGHVLDHTTFTSTVTINQSAIASAVAIVSASAISFNGSTEVDITFYCMGSSVPATAGANVQYFLFDGSTSLGCIAYHRSQAAQSGIVPVFGRYRLTPSNASHTYSIKATCSTGNGAANAGSGGATLTDFLPGHIRISIAS